MGEDYVDEEELEAESSETPAKILATYWTKDFTRKGKANPKMIANRGFKALILSEPCRNKRVTIRTPSTLGEADLKRREELIMELMPIIVRNLGRIRLGLAIQRYYRAKGRRVVKLWKGLRMWQLFRLRRQSKLMRWGRMGGLLWHFVWVLNHTRAWKAKVMVLAAHEKEIWRIKEEKIAQWGGLAKLMYRVILIRRQVRDWLARARRSMEGATEKREGKKKATESTTVAESTEILRDVAKSMQATIVAGEREMELGSQEIEEDEEEEEVPVAKRALKILALRPQDLREDAKVQLLKDVWA